MDAIFLVGGRGIRLTKLEKLGRVCPKPMHKVAGRPFVEWLLLDLRAQGIERFIFCTGYKGNMFSEHFGNGSAWDVEVVYSHEDTPLGTAGALRHAVDHVQTSPVLVLNGDSYCPVDVATLRRTHRQKGACATLWLTVSERSTQGGIVVEDGGKVTAFNEKAMQGIGVVSAGVYLMEREVIEAIPAKRKLSLETDTFPNLFGCLYTVMGSRTFLRMDTPELLRDAELWMGRVGHAQLHLIEVAAVLRATADKCLDTITKAAALLGQSISQGGKVLLCGNGGSAADCQHMAAELVVRLNREREALPAIALTTNTSVLTAYANDYNYEGIFARQVQALGQRGDVLIAISTSGESANVLVAAEAAKCVNMSVICLTGQATSKLSNLADVAIHVPSDNTLYVQAVHIVIEHIICDSIERQVGGKSK